MTAAPGPGDVLILTGVVTLEGEMGFDKTVSMIGNPETIKSDRIQK